MGMGKPSGEFVEELTEPGGWPDIDETSLYDRATELTNTRDKVAGVLEHWRRQQGELFSSGVWSGSGADAGNGAVENRIAELSNLQQHLEKVIAWYRLVAGIITQTKMTITQNLEDAQKVIAAFRNDPNLDDDAREDAIRAYVIAQNALNTSVVLNMGTQVPAFSTWQLPPGAVPPVAPASSEPVPGNPPSPQPPVVMEGLAPSPPTPTISPVSHVVRTPVGLDGLGPSEPPGPTGPAVSQPQAPAASAPGLASASSGSSPSSGIGTSSPGGGLSSPSSSTGMSTPSSPTAGSPTPVNPAATTGQPGDPAAAGAATPTAAAAQPVMPQAPLGAPTAAAPPAPAPAPTTPSAPPSAPISNASGPGGIGSGGISGGGAGTAAPVGAAPGPSAPSPPMPLGPPTTPPPAAPTPGAAPAGPMGPGVMPASAANAAASAAPAPVPVSAARAERDAIAAAATAGALRRQAGGNDPLQLARRIGAALNVGITDFGFFWVTGLAGDGAIVVANSYGLAYIPGDVNLPDQVRMATADESIPLADRARWATYPILAVQGWAQHHNTNLRAVVATQEQFANFDPGVAKIVLQSDDIPAIGKMEGRNRLEVISPETAARLAAVSDGGLTELLPPAPADTNPPADETHTLWFEVAKPLMSTSPERGAAHLQAFLTYANHAQELALYRAQTATDALTQRAAIADWVYWQHLSVLTADAVSSGASV